MKIKIMIAGGGTGGHVFPAIAIANELKEQIPDIDILFVGANKRMEMKRVPEAGYEIKGIDMYGLQRQLTLKNIIANLKLPFRLWRSLRKAKRIIHEFNPNVVIGVGGYVSGPVLKMAAGQKIPTLIQEQNSYPGITNKMLAKKAKIICTAYDQLDQFFDANKIVKTGNPVRKDIIHLSDDKTDAYAYFKLQASKKTVSIVGGSLGSKTINESVIDIIADFVSEDVQLIWQTGEYYYQSIPENLKQLKGIKIMPFIQRMDYLYQVSDIIVSRAGALAISELCIVAKACILIPSPNVAEDHQTKNAKVLSDAGAAILIADKDAKEKLGYVIFDLIQNKHSCEEMSKNLKKLAIPDATKRIVNEVKKLL
ncbi:MAG: undecaprenyldiphospho-muramoylpentapeptide beta-N-acetylglucosaminyltransferase [Bacteroidales bacterium]|jgi:UDP-N-acetylglucosamine--N-acetylmuramyl-(pentapeptide) pyrophosphoryl-undecaprenol N-acetylglucosamine transferase|nr:undecaprenyldiphospho-muramoylpentapeptide beta-N-acetylglucosaminyltransferase [Bacteroidales bacterium]